MNTENSRCFPDFRRAARFRKSWSCAVPGFEKTLKLIRQTPVPPEEYCRLINFSSGKSVYRGNHEKWDFAYKTQAGKTFWRYLFRNSLPLRECCNYVFLSENGFPVPQVLAAGDTRSCWVLKESFIITAFLDQTFDGRIFMPGGKLRTGSEELRHAYCEGHLKLLAKLHNAGKFHKAAHPRNFLFRGDSPENIELFWIDVARMRPAKDRRRTVIVDLHTFFRDMRLGRDEVLELIKVYLQELKNPLFASADELLGELRSFKRRRFSKRRYKLFDTD